MIDSLFWLTIARLGILCAGAAIAWPRLGLWAQWRRYRESRRRALAEDALKHLHTSVWNNRAATVQSLAGVLQISERRAVRLVQQMEALGWLRCPSEGLFLTAEGERLAIEVIRAHRLWERYLADEARMPLGAIHAEAERREHNRPVGSMSALDAAMGHPTTDPHGDPIPSADGQLAKPPTMPLIHWPLNSPARIVHLEDEPPALFSQILAEGLRPGLVVQVIEASARHLVLSDGEKVYTLAPVVAANVFVQPHSAEGRAEIVQTLAGLRPGRRATVARLDDSLQGFTRRRLLDLGLTPGATITAEMQSLFGDPAAYRVRGTLIALRREQAEKVLIRVNGNK